MNYQEWIELYEAENKGFVRGQCMEATQKMQGVYPELVIVKGHVYCAWGKDAHAWCVDPDGAIVDPTLAQFGGPVSYEPWEPGDEVRAGRCMNCGRNLYDSADTLDEEPPRRTVCGPREDPEDPKRCLDALNDYYVGV